MARVVQSLPPTAMSDAALGLKDCSSGPFPVVMPFCSRIFLAIILNAISWEGPILSFNTLSKPCGPFS